MTQQRLMRGQRARLHRRSIEGRIHALLCQASKGLLGLMLLVGVSACGSGGRTGQTASDNAAAAEEPAAYEVFLEGALRDTLRGPARFGVVFDPETERERLVIELVTTDSPASGIYLTPGDTLVPATGEYTFQPRIDADAARSFHLDYRHGMLRRLVAASGTLVIEEASDSLITGRFDAALRGQVVDPERVPGELPTEGESTVHAQGAFRATRGEPGYIIDVRRPCARAWTANLLTVARVTKCLQHPARNPLG